MKIESLEISGTPAVLYGETAKQGYLFLHGQMGHKEEAEAFIHGCRVDHLLSCFPGAEAPGIL